MCIISSIFSCTPVLLFICYFLSAESVVSFGDQEDTINTIYRNYTFFILLQLNCIIYCKYYFHKFYT